MPRNNIARIAKKRIEDLMQKGWYIQLANGLGTADIRELVLVVIGMARSNSIGKLAKMLNQVYNPPNLSICFENQFYPSVQFFDI